VDAWTRGAGRRATAPAARSSVRRVHLMSIPPVAVFLLPDFRLGFPQQADQ